RGRARSPRRWSGSRRRTSRSSSRKARRAATRRRTSSGSRTRMGFGGRCTRSSRTSRPKRRPIRSCEPSSARRNPRRARPRAAARRARPRALERADGERGDSSGCTSARSSAFQTPSRPRTCERVPHSDPSAIGRTFRCPGWSERRGPRAGRVAPPNALRLISFRRSYDEASCRARRRCFALVAPGGFHGRLVIAGSVTFVVVVATGGAAAASGDVALPGAAADGPIPGCRDLVWGSLPAMGRPDIPDEQALCSSIPGRPLPEDLWPPEQLVSLDEQNDYVERLREEFLKPRLYATELGWVGDAHWRLSGDFQGCPSDGTFAS